MMKSQGCNIYLGTIQLYKHLVNFGLCQLVWIVQDIFYYLNINSVHRYYDSFGIVVDNKTLVVLKLQNLQQSPTGNIYHKQIKSLVTKDSIPFTGGSFRIEKLIISTYFIFVITIGIQHFAYYLGLQKHT